MRCLAVITVCHPHNVMISKHHIDVSTSENTYFLRKFRGGFLKEFAMKYAIPPLNGIKRKCPCEERESKRKLSFYVQKCLLVKQCHHKITHAIEMWKCQDIVPPKIDHTLAARF